MMGYGTLASVGLAAAAGAFMLCVNQNAPTKGVRRIEVTLEGGHQTDPRDHGRPVNLVAGALHVPPSVFREAFSHVRPSPGGETPGADRVRSNKDALLSRLSRYGVSNDRLDEVSNYYRYRPQEGEMWPTREAHVFALVKKGAIVGFEVKDGGCGYTTAPEITVPGVPNLHLTAQISYSQAFEKNGQITAITSAH